jgi:hypothetical protein
MDVNGPAPNPTTNISNTPDFFELDPAWQPDVVAATYARPKGATPLSVSLVPAFVACTAENTTHGAPLSFGSCAPPAQASTQLTVGTPDANGKPANSVASEQVEVIAGNPSTPGDEADLRFTMSATDVRIAGTLDDYEGTLLFVDTVRITDKDSNGPLAATTVDTPFGLAVPCVPVSSAQFGSTCSLTTTAETVVPGAIKEGKRAVWGIGPVQVYDGGPDGDASTTADNTLFLTEGVFVP